MEGILGRRFLVLVIVAVAAVSITETAAQDSRCAGVAELQAPCQEYYKNTTLTPSEECCCPLGNVFINELPCICAVLTNPGLQKQLGLDVQIGMGLVSRCNITGVSPDACTPAPAPSPKNPPAPAPGPGPGKSPPSSSGAPFGAEWIGLSAFFSLFLFIMA